MICLNKSSSKGLSGFSFPQLNARVFTWLLLSALCDHILNVPFTKDDEVKAYYQFLVRPKVIK
jgi:hypothetical protein